MHHAKRRSVCQGAEGEKSSAGDEYQVKLPDESKSLNSRGHNLSDKGARAKEDSWRKEMLEQAVMVVKPLLIPDEPAC